LNLTGHFNETGPGPADSPAGLNDNRLAVLTAGYASLDRVFRVSHLPASGATAIIEAGDDRLYRGGCAFNIAAGLNRLKLKTGVLGWLGDDEAGQAYRAFLEETGIDVTGLGRVAGPGPRSFIYYDPSGSSQCYFQPGPAGAKSEMDRQLEQVRRAGWLVLTVAYPWQTALLLEEAIRLQVPVVWSVKADKTAYPPDLVDRLVRNCRILFLNRDELDFIKENSPFGSPESLVEAGVELVVLTLGAAGSRVYAGGTPLEVPARPVSKVQDPTGSGDAYIAGFMAAYITTKSPAGAALAGSANAAAVLEQFGSQTGLCNWEELAWRLR
jgi:nucleoside kinase